MTKMMFTFALVLLISGCEDMKMDRKAAKPLQPANQVSQRNAVQDETSPWSFRN